MTTVMIRGRGRFYLAGRNASPMYPLNRELSGIFRKMAACYRYLGAAERFRSIAYDRAARTIEGLDRDLSAIATDMEALDRLKDIGESIAGKIAEHARTGRIRTFEELKAKVPMGLLGLMEVAGVGPATARMLHERLGISNWEQLSEAIEAGRLETLKGFGAKKTGNLRRALKLKSEMRGRLLLGEAMSFGEPLLERIRGVKGVVGAELAGSLRRMKETVGDIDIVVAAKTVEHPRISRALRGIAEDGRVVSAGPKRVSFVTRDPEVEVDIRIVDISEYGAALLYFTGSREHNIKLRTLAREKGWKLNEYGVFETDTDKRLGGGTEREVYQRLGLQWIEPEMREDRGEIEAAAAGSLPKPMDVKGLRGDMQMHSDWSDGADTIAAIAETVGARFPAYGYIVMTDHSPSARIAGGLPIDDFKRQWEEIDRVNQRLGKCFVRKGVEVDILADGSLDLSDAMLAEFEWVTASIHSGFSHDNTERLVAACRNPFVNCIGHPSGRLIGGRDAYAVDWQRLFREAAASGTALEVNAQPQRLDLRDELVRQAVTAGVRITISSDAHDLEQFSSIRFGIGTARRGWATGQDVLNTEAWEVVAAFRDHKRKRAAASRRRGRREKVSA